MHYLLIFVGGLLAVKNWAKLGHFAAQASDGAAAKFDELYSAGARKVGQSMEDIEDKIVHKRYLAGQAPGTREE